MGFEELIEDNYCYPGNSLRQHLIDIWGIECVLIYELGTVWDIKGELLEFPGHRSIKSICHSGDRGKVDVQQTAIVEAVVVFVFQGIRCCYEIGNFKSSPSLSTLTYFYSFFIHLLQFYITKSPILKSSDSTYLNYYSPLKYFIA